MTDQPTPATGPPPRIVHSDLAEPSRPLGYDGPHQPIAAAPVFPPEDRPSDGILAALVRDALAAEGRLEGQSITVAVRDGLVTLTGEVAREFQHGLATACASSVAGVLVVQNHLSVAQKGPAPGP